MVKYTADLYDAIKELALLKGKKKRSGTAIHYAEMRLKEIIENDGVKPRSKRSPERPQIDVPVEPFNGKGSAINRAYVLSRETHDLTQAIEALERLR